MLIEDRKATRRIDYPLAIGIGVVFLLVGLGSPGFWEPWESGLVQVADYMRHHSGNAHIFWVPQNENHLVYKPLAQIWSLMFVLNVADEPSEFLIRLPGALVALGTMLTAFAVMRRFFSRGAAFGTLLALVSLPMFIFGGRLLAAGIWPIAAVSLPLMFYLLTGWAQTSFERAAWGLAFGLSFAFAFLAGGFLSVAVIAVTLLAFAFYRRSTRVVRSFITPLAIVGMLLSVAICWGVFSQYKEHVAWALEDRLPLEPTRVASEIKAGNVEKVGVRNDVIVGVFTEEAQDIHGAQRFTLSVDGRENGTPLWMAWARNPTQMTAVDEALKSAGFADDSGRLEPFEEPADTTGANRTALEFFAYDLYDPAKLASSKKAVVRSTVAAAPGLGIVRAEPEDTDAFLLRLVRPLLPDEPQPEVDATTQPRTGDDATRAAERAARRKRAEEQEKAARRRAEAAAQSAEVGTVRNGQEVTILSEEDGWSEIELPGNKSGWVRSDALNPVPSLEHTAFHNWVRHLGFGLFPWILLIPAAFGILLLRRPHGESEEPDTAGEVGALLLIWFAVSVLALGLGMSWLNQRAFTGVVPVALASGVLIASGRFWSQVDTAPMVKKFIGFGAVCILGVMIHDYKEHPWLFIEGYLNHPEMEWEEKLQVLLTPWRIFRLAVAALIAGWFFGAIGFASRMLAKVVYFIRWRFSDQVERLKKLNKPDTPFANLSPKEKTWRVVTAPWTWGLRYVALVIWGGMQALREPRLVLALIAVGSAVLSVFVYLPAMSHHLTQKGLLIRYQELADEGEPLVSMQNVGERSCRFYSDCEPGFACVRGRCKPEATSFYLGGIENVSEKELIDRLMEEERLFAVIPRDKLARVNSRFRQRFEIGERENLAVLDTRSSRFLLVSNDLESGETDENYVADLILDEKPQPEYPVRRPLRFSNGLEFLGYDLDPDEVGSGEELTITYYFKVTRDINQDWQMFLHIDYPGNRINGDHYPGDGEFRTNTWLAGDYIKDIQKLEIDRGSSAGLYEMWFGFFSSGDNRLKVETGDSDGGDRVRMGTLRVTGGI